MNALLCYPQLALNRWRSGEVLCNQGISLSCAPSRLIIVGDLWKFYGKLQVLSEHDSMSRLCDCCLVPVL